MSTLIYYVYAYLRKSNNTPYYIGKGKDNRAYKKHIGVTTPLDKSKIVFLETSLSEIGSLALERRMIRWYGRKDLGTGILNNRTDGGEGVSGYVTPPDRRAAISRANTGEGNGMYGKTHTGDAKRRISIGHTGIRLSDEHKEAVGAAHRGKSLTDEHRAKCSKKLSGKNNPNYGKKISEEQKEKFRATMSAKRLLRNEHYPT
jgi:hypothetical protein